jgi:hypothetical protein
MSNRAGLRGLLRASRAVRLWAFRFASPTGYPSSSGHNAKRPAQRGCGAGLLYRVRDSNPRDLTAYRLIKGAPSTIRPALRRLNGSGGQTFKSIDERDQCVALASGSPGRQFWWDEKRPDRGWQVLREARALSRSANAAVIQPNKTGHIHGQYPEPPGKSGQVVPPRDASRLLQSVCNLPRCAVNRGCVERMTHDAAQSSAAARPSVFVRSVSESEAREDSEPVGSVGASYGVSLQRRGHGAK